MDSTLADSAESRILEILKEIVGKPVGLDDELVQSRIVDSIAAVDLALKVEEEFGCSIAPHELTRILSTPRTLIAHVTAKQ